MPKAKHLKKGKREGEEKAEPLSPSRRLGFPGNLPQTLAVLSLLLATLFVYWPVGTHGFVNFDDDLYVTENPKVQAGLTRENVIWAFTTTRAGNWHPLTWLSHMLDCHLFGMNPGPHHLTSLFFHLANTLLLFWVLKRMTASGWASCFAAALFALHPLRVESVAWVAERKDVLSAFFWILTMAMYLRYVEKPGLRSYLPVVLFFVLGLMCKPMAVTLPFVLLLLDYWPLGRFSLGKGRTAPDASVGPPREGKRPARGGNPPRASWEARRRVGLMGASQRSTSQKAESSLARLALEKAPLFLISAGWSALTFFVQKGAGSVYPLDILPLEDRMANAVLSYGRYLEKTFRPFDLAVFYPYPEAASPWQLGLAGAMLIGMSFGVLYGGRRRRYLPVGWLWYLGTLLPVIGLVQVGSQAMADRYTYLPLIGIFLLVAMGAPDLLQRWRHHRKALAVSAALAVSFCGLVSREQVHYWKNSVTLFERALAVTERNDTIHNNLGVVLAQQGKVQEAAAHYSRALQIRPQNPEAHNNLGVVLALQGKIREAAGHYSLALQIRPQNAEAHNNLGVVLAQEGKTQEAAAHYSLALQIKPDYPEAHNNLGMVLAQQGRIREAAAHYSRALQIKPDYAEAHNNLGMVLAQQGRIQEATAHYSTALRIKPSYVQAHLNLGMALYQQGKAKEAIEHFSGALEAKGPPGR